MQIGNIAESKLEYLYYDGAHVCRLFNVFRKTTIVPCSSSYSQFHTSMAALCTPLAHRTTFPIANTALQGLQTWTRIGSCTVMLKEAELHLQQMSYLTFNSLAALLMSSWGCS